MAVALACGLQLLVLGLAGMVLIPTMVIRAAGGTDAYLSWAVFWAVAVSGVCAALQAVRLGRVGAGHVLAMGPPVAFIGVSVTALAEGGPALLATLVVASSLVPIAISMRLAVFRRGVVAGSFVAGFLGLYDPSRVVAAAWIGVPPAAWPGVELDAAPAFVQLLPAFVFVAAIGAIQTITGAVAIQRVSWRRPRAVDYRAVQGAVAADGIGKLLAGFAGIMPTQTIGVSVSAVDLTGVAARRVGVVAGGLLIALAFLPKLLALVLAIPSPVAAAYLTVMLAMIFVRGMTEVVQGGIDHRKGSSRASPSGSAWAAKRHDLPRAPGRPRRRRAGERPDRGRPRGHLHDPVHQCDCEAASHGDGPRSDRAAADQGVPRRVRGQQWLGRKDGRPPGRGQRGDIVDVAGTGREPRDARAFSRPLRSRS